MTPRGGEDMRSLQVFELDSGPAARSIDSGRGVGARSGRLS